MDVHSGLLQVPEYEVCEQLCPKRAALEKKTDAFQLSNSGNLLGIWKGHINTTTLRREWKTPECI